MIVKVLLFAILRERAGSSSVEVSLDDGATVADALDVLAGRPELGDVIARMPIRMAVNREYADGEDVLAAGDELALVPPVSGGGEPDADPEAVHARITEEPLDLAAVTRLVGRPGAGAIVSFQGTTRDVARLEYEAYLEMAEERIASILRECLAKHDLEAIAGEHRVGAVPLGEASVIVAASSAHRGEAFAGAHEAIDRLKAEAPIWKREIEEGDGGETARWVKGTAPEADRERAR